MKLDLSNDIHRNKFKTYCNKLYSSNKKVEIKEVREPRTIKQNAYLHVCITLYAIEFGYSLEEAKTDLKRQCGFMVYEKSDKKFLKRTRYLNTKELTDFIEWIRNYASMNGLYIPNSEEYLIHKFDIDSEIDRHKKYL